MDAESRWGLWEAIRDEPFDDVPRLIYADWLDEHGDPARAEFIRIQCNQNAAQTELIRIQCNPNIAPEMRRLSKASRKEMAEQDARVKVLIDAHGDRWLRPIRQILRGSNGDDQWLERLRFRRGFVDAQPFDLECVCRLARAEESVEPCDRIWCAAQSAEFKHERLLEIAKWKGARSVFGLSIGGGADRDIAAIVGSAHLCKLANLGVWGGAVTNVGVMQLAEWPLAAGLRTLDLKDTQITDVGASALAESPNLGSLCLLDVSRTKIGASGMQQLRIRFGHSLQGWYLATP